MVGTSERGVSRCCARVRPKFWDWRAMGRSHSHRALPSPHDCLRAGPDCANDHGYAPRAVCRIPPLRLAHALVGDWPSQTSRPGLGQSPHRPYGVARSRRPRGQPAVGATGRSPCGKGIASPTTIRPCGPLRTHSSEIGPVCSSGRALHIFGRVKGATLVAKNPGYPLRRGALTGRAGPVRQPPP